MYGACLSGFDDAFTPSNVTGGYTTSFPSPITRGATFDADLERQLTSAVGDEVRGLFAAKGVGAKSCNGPLAATSGETPGGAGTTSRTPRTPSWSP